MSKILDIFIEEVEPIKGVKDVIPSIVFQPINRDEIRLFSKNGGNCLGIEPGEGPFICMSPSLLVPPSRHSHFPTAFKI
jgi:hypothetical protein